MTAVDAAKLKNVTTQAIHKELKAKSLESYKNNKVEFMEEKLDKIIEETEHQNMTLISGIPPWVQMYFDKLVDKHGKKVGEIFKNFSILVQGGVNFEPYKAKLFESQFKLSSQSEL